MHPPPLQVIDKACNYERDYAFDYFGYKTLEKAYLMRIDGVIVERPQHVFMRVALGIHLNDIAAAIETYELMSKKMFTHATPTLFNAGTIHNQLASCFLLQIQEDNVAGLF
jgi:ribonucleotide reductase alpha subunit